ncbi:hypothetical protein PsYK624_016400 [Phanerochaete sordida]|uniref:Uncharacterized protein n=1 Tax=Phanerochaete sordida TaxID=48140 RepID=A0A9P3FZQ9_9APHY|nr:hypothetical protein PsYK624_016400 [Phanerochaete sordida]
MVHGNDISLHALTDEMLGQFEANRCSLSLEDSHTGVLMCVNVVLYMVSPSVIKWWVVATTSNACLRDMMICSQIIN